VVPALVALGARFAGGAPLTALHVLRSDRPSTYLREGEEAEPLAVLREYAEARGVQIEAITCVASEPARDIVRVAVERSVKLLLLGTHRPLLVEGELGGVVGRVLHDAPMDVGVLVYRGLHDIDSVSVAEGVDDPSVTMVIEALNVPRVTTPGPGTLYLGVLDTDVPDGVTALLLKPRKR
jgi:nucleotide-binding universal stress UspA family protein